MLVKEDSKLIKTLLDQITHFLSFSVYPSVAPCFDGGLSISNYMIELDLYNAQLIENIFLASLTDFYCVFRQIYASSFSLVLCSSSSQ